MAALKLKAHAELSLDGGGDGRQRPRPCKPTFWRSIWWPGVIRGSLSVINEIGKQKRLVEMSSGNDRVAPQKEKGYPLLTFQSGCKCFAIFSHLFLDLLPFFISVIPPLLLLSYLLESFSQSPPLASFPTLTSKCGVSWTPL